jgi:hypothetical protein
MCGLVIAAALCFGVSQAMAQDQTRSGGGDCPTFIMGKDPENVWAGQIAGQKGRRGVYASACFLSVDDCFEWVAAASGGLHIIRLGECSTRYAAQPETVSYERYTAERGLVSR